MPASHAYDDAAGRVADALEVRDMPMAAKLLDACRAWALSARSAAS